MKLILKGMARTNPKKDGIMNLKDQFENFPLAEMSGLKFDLM